MRRYILSALFTILAFATASAQVSSKVDYKRVSPTEIDVIYTLTPQPGWHIYSTNIPAGGPTSATFEVDSKSGAELVGGLKAGPGAKTVNDPIFEMQVSWFEHPCTFTQRLKLTAKDYNLKGYLRYGACNDESCLPPQSVNCSVSGSDGPSAAASDANAKEADKKKAEAENAKTDPKNALMPADAANAAQQATNNDIPVETMDAEAAAALIGMQLAGDSLAADSLAGDSLTANATATDGNDHAKWWKPVINDLKALDGENDYGKMSLWYIFLLGLLGGLVALFTPCVWPIIPMTVSFFLKRSSDRKKGIKDAVIYGISIVVIYVSLGLIITALFGASALNDLSTNAVFNIIFFLMLVVFAASFFGGFEITLPSSWTNKVNDKSEKVTGLLSIFLMAFTLSLVSFSCTGPIIGFLLVEVGTAGSSMLAPTIGMLGFAIALALPFTLFALFPSWLKSAPKSGGWMNTVKVTLGFLELAFALKFLSVADLAYGWHILDRETFLALWIVIFGLLGVYLLGRLKFPHDDDNQHTSVPRFFLALCSLSFAVYMVPGLWGAPCKAISAFAPPMSTQDFVLDKTQVEAKFKNYDQGMQYAKQAGKPVMVDFTGFGCVNCRKMEMAVWQDPKVVKLLNEDYVLISLYVDDKTKLPEPQTRMENGQEVTLRTIGDYWSYLQRTKFGANAQPFYVLLDNEGNPLNASYAYDEDVDKYVEWLNKGLQKYRSK